VVFGVVFVLLKKENPLDNAGFGWTGPASFCALD
jgi:hypothetical protein